MSISANEMTVIKEQAYAGYPSRLPGVCWVQPVTVGEMLKMGSNVYSSRLGMLLLTPDEIRKIMEERCLIYSNILF